MTREDIIRMAHEAGLHLATDVNWMPIIDFKYAQKFAELVAAEAKLECIDLLMKMHEQAGDRHNYFAYAARALRGEK